MKQVSGPGVWVVCFTAALLGGCSTIKYTDGDSSFERTSYFTFAQISKMTVTINGNQRTLELEGTSDQVQALEKVAEGVAKGMVQGAKP